MNVIVLIFWVCDIRTQNVTSNYRIKSARNDENRARAPQYCRSRYIWNFIARIAAFCCR